MKFIDKLTMIPDHEYREIPAFSYSLLKEIDESGPKAINEQISKSSPALEFGQLVDILITDPKRKDNVFHTKTLVPPTASLLQLADSLLLDVMINDDKFEDITDETIQMRIKELGLWSSMVDKEKLKAKYDNELFYDYLRESIEARGKIIVTPEVLEAAERCVNTLKLHDFTRDYFIESEDIEIVYQPSIIYKFKGVHGKARLDLIKVDHKNKIIYPIDIKTGSELPSKFTVSFYKYKYYLQVVSYLLGIQYILNTTDEFKDYKIANFKFLYVSKKLPDVPVVWEVPEALLNNFADGWGDNTGFLELVENYKFAHDTGIFNVERKIMERNGNLKIELL